MANDFSGGLQNPPSAGVPGYVHPQLSTAPRHHRWIIWGLWWATLVVGGPMASLPTASAQSEPFAAEAPASTGTTWIIVRHADRDGDADRLTEAGIARAEELARFASPLRVAALYSTDYQRTQDTLRPLARQQNLSIVAYQHPTAEWLAAVRRAHSGKVIVVVGHSNTVGEIVHQLSGQPSFTLPHDEYDSLFLVSEQTQPATVLRLKFGASSAPSGGAPPVQMGPIRHESPAQPDRSKR